ncbi:MAG: CHAT domain-containing protein [Gemmatimonadaceae bacterium]
MTFRPKISEAGGKAVSDAQPLVYPLILKSTLSVADSEQVIDSANTVNAKRVENAALRSKSDDHGVALNRSAAVEWVLLQHAIGFDVAWYLFRFELFKSAVASAKIQTKSLWDELRPDNRQLAKIIQFGTYDEKSTGPAVILAGNRFVGVLAPAVNAETRSGAERIVNFGGPTRVAPSGSGRSGNSPTVAPQSVPPTGSSKPHLGQMAKPPEPPTTRSAAPGALQVDSAPTSLATQIEAGAFINAPRIVQQNQKFKIEIGLAAKPSDGVEGSVFTISYAANEQEILLDVDVQCEGFTSEKSLAGTLRIPPSDPYTPRITFWITASALAENSDEELRAIQVHYARKGIACGSATVRILVQRETKKVQLPTAVSPPATVAVNSAAPNIDLTLRIAWKDDNEATQTLCWSFVSPHDIPAPGRSMVKGSTQLGAFAIGIIDALGAADAHIDLKPTFEGIASTVRSQMPLGVWDVLDNTTKAVRAARGPNAIPTVLLLTQETRVPWELALMPDDQLRNPDAPFLNTHFIVTRWLLDDYVRPLPQYEATAKDLAAIIGDYSKTNSVANLPFAKKEAESLEKHHATSFPATREEITEILMGQAKNSAGNDLAPGVIHFSGHGEANRSDTVASFLVLNDGTNMSMATFLNAFALKKYHPMIFLNACQLGAATTMLGQSGGFAAFCVRGQCSAVIAPLWSVNDQVAYDISTKFYDDVLGDANTQGIPVAEAMFNARQTPYTKVTITGETGAAKDVMTATRMAYLVYGHPAFRP